MIYYILLTLFSEVAKNKKNESKDIFVSDENEVSLNLS